VNQPTRAPWHF